MTQFQLTLLVEMVNMMELSNQTNSSVLCEFLKTSVVIYIISKDSVSYKNLLSYRLASGTRVFNCIQLKKKVSVSDRVRYTVSVLSK